MRILIALLLLAPLAVVADGNSTPTNLSWEPPTEREDGSALDPATEIESYTLVCEGAANLEHSIPGLSATGEYDAPYADVFPDHGEYTCRLNAVDTDGRVSDLSAESVTINWTPSAPRTPTNFMRLTDGNP